MYVGAFSFICVTVCIAINQTVGKPSKKVAPSNGMLTPRIFPNWKPVPFHTWSAYCPATTAQKSIMRRGFKPDSLLKSPRALSSLPFWLYLVLCQASRAVLSSSFLPSDATFTAVHGPLPSFSIPHFIRTGVPGLHLIARSFRASLRLM